MYLHNEVANAVVMLGLDLLLGSSLVSILDFIGAKDDGGGGDNWSYKTCKAPVKSSSPTKQHQAFTGWMPNQQCRSIEGKLMKHY